MNEMPNATDLRTVCCQLAELGAATARRFFGKVTVSRKADDTPVTQADHATQEAILAELGRRFPAHAVLTEEEMRRPDRHAGIGAADYCWVIDPIDGTRNFARGVGVWSTAVAVLHRGRPIAGAIHDAVTQDTYSAAAGMGASRGHRRITLVDRPIDSDTAIALGSFRRQKAPDAVRRWMDLYLARNYGSLCLHLAWVADGLVEATYACECKVWDIAAGSLIIEEAGGMVTDLTGQPIWPLDLARYDGQDTPILAAAPQMHGILLSDLRQGAGPPR